MSQPAVINLDDAKRLVVVANKQLTTEVYTIDPEDVSPGWNKVSGGVPAMISADDAAVAMHGGRTAHLVYYGAEPKWQG